MQPYRNYTLHTAITADNNALAFKFFIAARMGKYFVWKVAFRWDSTVTISLDGKRTGGPCLFDNAIGELKQTTFKLS